MSPFINGQFLWFLVPVIAAPIIIHLLNRRKHRRVPWAAMRFLEAAFKRTNRRVRMEHLILLLLRILLMILLVLAIARPMVQSDSALAVLGQSKRNLILVVDTSYSMNYRGGITETHFDRAIDISERILADLDTRRGDTVTLISMGDDAEVLQERSAWLEKGLEDVALLEATAGSADLRGALVEALSVLDHPEMQVQSELVMISDFQRLDWEEGEDADERGGSIRDLLGEISEREVPVALIDVGSRKTWNLAVTDLRAEEKAVGIRRPVRITAEITNWGTEITSPSASLWIGENKVAAESLRSMGPEERRSVSFHPTFLEPGDTPVRLEVDPEVKDQLETDNARYLAVDVRDRIRVLAVDGDPSFDPLEGSILDSETGYLVLALDPKYDTPLASDSLFEIVPAADYDLALQDFSEYDWIAIANLREIGEAKARELRDAVRGGSGLLLFLGNQVEPELYNGRLFGPGDERVLPGSLAAARLFGEGDSVEFRVDDFTHPVLRFFGAEELRPLLTKLPKTRGFLPYDPGPENPDLRVLARYTDEAGSPAICERLLGNGRVLLFTTSANAEWTTFPTDFGFLPMMQEIGAYLAADETAARNLLAGERITFEIDKYAPRAWVELPSAERRRLEVQSSEEQDRQRFLIGFEETSEPGIYRIGGLPSDSPEADGDEADRLFAVNVNAREGDLRSIDQTELRSRFPEFDFSFRRHYARATDDEGRPREGEIWKYLLVSVLALLLLEGFLAQYFGDYSRR